jgi:hypothetical protein
LTNHDRIRIGDCLLEYQESHLNDVPVLSVDNQHMSDEQKTAML